MNKMILLTIAALAVFVFAGYTLKSLKVSQTQYQVGINMNITSPTYLDGQSIPLKYTCDGENINPAYDISSIPTGAISLAFVLDDLDSPRGTFTHWIFWDVDPKTTQILEGKQPVSTAGKNTFGTSTYGGPCPTQGTHRYRLTVYALDVKLDLPEGATKADFEQAINGHILAEGQLTGTYTRTK